MLFHRPAALMRPGGDPPKPVSAHLEDWGMSTFDDPFDADRGLSRAGCACGQHRSAEEHDRAAPQLRLRAGALGGRALRGCGGIPP